MGRRRKVGGWKKGRWVRRGWVIGMRVGGWVVGRRVRGKWGGWVEKERLEGEWVGEEWAKEINGGRKEAKGGKKKKVKDGKKKEVKDGKKKEVKKEGWKGENEQKKIYKIIKKV